MKYDFEPIQSAAAIAEQSQRSVIRLLIAALEQMERRVRELEERGDQTADMAFDDRVLRVIEENSYTTFTHLEAEIDEKLDQMTQSYGFAEAVEEAVKGSIVSTVEDVISELGVIDPEEIVRAGLKAII